MGTTLETIRLQQKLNPVFFFGSHKDGNIQTLIVRNSQDETLITHECNEDQLPEMLEKHLQGAKTDPAPLLAVDYAIEKKAADEFSIMIRSWYYNRDRGEHVAIDIHPDDYCGGDNWIISYKHQIPVQIGEKYGEESATVAEIGELYRFSHESAFLPVKLSDGTFRMLSCRKGEVSISKTLDVESVISNSIEMPRIGHGIGSDVLHIFGKDDKGDFLAKVYYNAKAEYRDNEVLRKGKGLWSKICSPADIDQDAINSEKEKE